MSAFSSYICGGKQQLRVVSFQMLQKDFSKVNMCIAIVSYWHKCCGACLHYFRYKFGPMTSSQADLVRCLEPWRKVTYRSKAIGYDACKWLQMVAISCREKWPVLEI